MKIKIMEPDDAPETQGLSHNYAVLAFTTGSEGKGWYVAWLDGVGDRRDVFIGGSLAERDQALATAQNYFAANGMN
ncbi:hypothetical protein ACFW19_13250 [Streptomyces nigra]|uniref:hypothetical protein n=1 Tax=Streptomyces nigra TaxID=1827580 RepID=UPI0036BA93BF